jgi:flagellar export protein FliJ
MKRDPLGTLLRVRQSTLDDARKAVAEAYRVERQASDRTEQAGDVLASEMRLALKLEGGDDAVETFARWLPLGRHAIRQAHKVQHDATTRLDHARAVLNLARSGVRTVETLIDQRDQMMRQQSDHREQRLLDEAGARKHYS